MIGRNPDQPAAGGDALDINKAQARDQRGAAVSQEGIETRTAVDHPAAAAGQVGQRVVAIATTQGIGAGTADEPVIACAAAEQVIARVTHQQVIARPAEQRVVTGRATDADERLRPARHIGLPRHGHLQDQPRRPAQLVPVLVVLRLRQRQAGRIGLDLLDARQRRA